MLEAHRRQPSPEAVAAGASIMVIGLLLLLEQAGVLRGVVWWSFWPLALIYCGLAKLLVRPNEGPREGGWLLFIGAWLLLNHLNVLAYQSWPLFVVALGINIIWNAFVSQHASAE